MNGKKAKLARKLTMPDGHYVPTSYIEGHPPVYVSFAHDSEGNLVPSLEGSIYRKIGEGVPTILDPNCTRVDYKQLKKNI